MRASPSKSDTFLLRPLIPNGHITSPGAGPSTHRRANRASAGISPREPARIRSLSLSAKPRAAASTKAATSPAAASSRARRTISHPGSTAIGSATSIRPPPNGKRPGTVTQSATRPSRATGALNASMPNSTRASIPAGSVTEPAPSATQERTRSTCRISGRASGSMRLIASRTMRRAITTSAAARRLASSTSAPAASLRRQLRNACADSWDRNASSSPRISQAAPIVLHTLALRCATTGITRWRT